MNDDRACEPSPASQDAGADLSRRRLLRGGLGASPVLLTLAARPVSATTTCTVASSFVSVATFKSRNPGSTAQCTTRTCEWWKSECSSGTTWKSYMDSTTVQTHFGATNPSSTYAGRSLSAIMNDGGGIQTGTEIGVLQHLIALSMNLKAGAITSPGNLSMAYVNSVWTNFKTNGNSFKLPSSGINWNPTQVVTWARMLMYPSV